MRYQCTYLHALTNELISTFNNVAKVNHLGPSSNYHLFKQGIRPEWEDEANAEGGKFGIQFPKNKAGDAINEYWMYLVRFAPFQSSRIY